MINKLSRWGESAVTPCLFAWYDAVQETDCFVEDLGGWGLGRLRQQRVGGGVKARSPPTGCAPDVSCLASNRGEGHWPPCPRRQESGVPQERVCHFPGDGGVRTSVSVLQQRVVRERTQGPSCPQIPARGPSAGSCWSYNQWILDLVSD